MAFTFEQFAKEASKKEGFMNKAVESTTTFVKKAAETTKGIMPVTNRRFDAMVQGMYSEVNDVKKEAWKNKFMVHMLAHHTGMNMPSEDDLDALYQDYLAEEQAALEAAENAAKEEAMAKVTPVQEAPVEQSEQPSALQQVLNDPAALQELMALLNVKQPVVEVAEPVQAPVVPAVVRQEEVAEVQSYQCVANIASKQNPIRCTGVTNQEGIPCDECIMAGIKDVYADDMAALEVEEEPVVPVTIAEATEGEWKACEGCGKDLHVSYESDKCRDCRRSARQATPKPQGTTMRIAFDDDNNGDIPAVIK